MNPEHTGDMLRHLEKQDELLMNSYRSMSHYLHKLQVEEEMLMRKYYELMMAHGQIQKKEDGSVSVKNNIGLGETEPSANEETEPSANEETEPLADEETEPLANEDCNEK